MPSQHPAERIAELRALAQEGRRAAADLANKRSVRRAAWFRARSLDREADRLEQLRDRRSVGRRMTKPLPSPES